LIANLTQAKPVGEFDLRAEAAAILLSAAFADGADRTADPMECARLRHDARLWLSDSLANWRRVYNADPARTAGGVHSTLFEWRQNPHFAPVREAKSLSALPADERAAWGQFWQDVQSLHTEADRHIPVFKFNPNPDSTDLPPDSRFTPVSPKIVPEKRPVAPAPREVKTP
jgi:hypothetical protein